MIFEATILHIPRILELARKIKQAPPEEALKQMLNENIGKPNAKIYLYVMKEGIKGFIFASLEEFEGEMVAFIQVCVAEKDTYEFNATAELLARVNDWGIDSGAKAIYAITKRNPRPYYRKYRFKFHGVIIRRELKKSELKLNREAQNVGTI